MSWMSKLFGGGAAKAEGPTAASVEYEGFRITPEPTAEGKSWRIGAWIEKEVGGEAKRHHMIRADTLQTRDEAADASVAKAKVMIDQMGDRLFG